MFVGQRRGHPVAEALPRVGPPTTPMVSEAYGWAADAALFVAALATCRRRLPQGAPTSPLLAALAFMPDDKRILEAVGVGVTYTRYFDDLAFSVSAEEARARGFVRP